MSGWIGRDRTDPWWKQSWAERTLSSGPRTPLSLVVFLALAIFLLIYSHSSERQAKMRQALLDFQLHVFMVLVVIILYVYLASGARNDQTPVVNWRRPQEWDWTPFWVGGAVVALLFLVSYQNYIRSGWF